ncbi:S26 family signal peptidase, partial [Vibrio parahaemolyticus]|nr:S26 family signal peptidase [Vibrio parahaemolyticus]
MANTFSLMLVIATLVTGVVWLLEKLVFAKKRQEKLAEIQAQTSNGLDAVTLQKVERQPWWVENSVSIFPVIAFVLVLR